MDTKKRPADDPMDGMTANTDGPLRSSTESKPQDTIGDNTSTAGSTDGPQITRYEVSVAGTDSTDDASNDEDGSGTKECNRDSGTKEPDSPEGPNSEDEASSVDAPSTPANRTFFREPSKPSKWEAGKARLRKIAEGVADVADDARRGVRSIYGNGRDAVSRMTKGYDSTGIWELGPQLMIDIPKRLHKFAETTVGYPADYDDPANWLSIVPREDGWEDSFAPMGATRALYPYGDPEEGDVVPDGGNGILVRRKSDTDGRVITTFVRNKDVGLGFAAWIEDIDYAANIIEEWQSASGDVLWFDRNKDLYGQETAKEMYDTLQAKFKIVWEWLGENLPALWI